MATKITIETDRKLPPKGSSARTRLETAILTAVGTALEDAIVKVELVKLD